MRHSGSFCHHLGVEVCDKIQSGVTGGGRAQLEHKLKADQVCQAEVSSPDPLGSACTQHSSCVCDQGVQNGSSAVSHSLAGMIGRKNSNNNNSHVYWAVQAGLLTPLTFARHRLSPLAAFTSGAYFLYNGRQWQWICEFYTANFKGIFGGP